MLLLKEESSEKLYINSGRDRAIFSFGTNPSFAVVPRTHGVVCKTCHSFVFQHWSPNSALQQTTTFPQDHGHGSHFTGPGLLPGEGRTDKPISAGHQHLCSQTVAAAPPAVNASRNAKSSWCRMWQDTEEKRESLIKVQHVAYALVLSSREWGKIIQLRI